MAVITYEDVIPSLIENATMKKMLADGVHRTYMIEAIGGYVLRDNRCDWGAIDEETCEEYTVPVYASGSISVSANYDFTANPYEIYAVLENSVPADQVMGGGNLPASHDFIMPEADVPAE